MHAAALPPPLARLASVRHNAAAERCPAQEDINTFVCTHLYVHQPCNVPYQPCLQRQGMCAAALPPPLARLGFLRHNAVGDGRTAQEVAKSDVSTPYR